ncbi:MAG: HRDC domain-containing protein [Clostridium sp.]|nr:HRDC domain-containing protein [Clostridium sp.]MDU7085049.1 HRDC domain-containing protein [Clostridium sp.]
MAQSRNEDIKPYFIFNDNQLRDLISKMPATSAELLAVSSFGGVKVKKYGEKIITIVNKYK